MMPEAPPVPDVAEHAAGDPIPLVPEDATKALRFGWMVAEVKGRFRPGAPEVGKNAPPGPDTTLRLAAADERTTVERQVEAVKVLANLAPALHVDVAIEQMTGQNVADFPDKAKAGDGLKFLVSRLVVARNPKDQVWATLGMTAPTVAESSDATNWWDRLSRFIWAWDEIIQDTLASAEFGTASAYQLGRGLSEAYWSLDPNDPESWGFLLGENRVRTLKTLCTRLTPTTLPRLTAVAVEESVENWGKVAAHPDLYQNPADALARQTMVWRDLLLTNRDPKSLVDPTTLARAARRIGPLVRAFAPELTAGFIAAAVLGVSLFYVSNLFGTVGSVLGAFGVTTTALGARAKTTIQSVGKKIDDVVYRNVVAEAVQQLPAQHQKRRRHGRDEPTPTLAVAS